MRAAADVAMQSGDEAAQQRLRQASTHWLRHTFGTRSVARGVPADVIQAQMGHSSTAITIGLYGRAPLGRRSHELQKAFD